MTTKNTEPTNLVVWRHSMVLWAVLFAALALIIAMSFNGLAEMVRVWEVREEYGHGYIIPFITLFLIWQRKDRIEKCEFNGAWIGVFIVVLGASLVLLGNLSTIKTVTQYGSLITLLGVVYAYAGRGIRPILVPLLFLIFMIPLPGFFLNNLSSELQLISSKIGVAVIQLFDISVYLEGNVIDLGTYKLQVVEACSGLNYLFPLMSLAFMAAYFFRAALWKRAIVFLSSIPITVFMNSFRIGVIGVLVEYGGPEQAEGFLHDFEGWLVFMASIGILIGEIWLFAFFAKDKKPLRQVFGLEFPEDTPENVTIRFRSIPAPLIATVVILAVSAVTAFFIEDRQEIVPERQTFDSFPMQINGWHGRPDRLEQIYLDALKLDDYIIADYQAADKGGNGVNFYAAYYATQRAGEAAHSPRSCIPGGGWQINSLSQKEVSGVSQGGEPLLVNRLVIKKGEYAQVVYYWFQQRGRDITNEYMVKWYLFWDALTRNRTDGALVRLTTLIKPGEELDVADARLESFLKEINPYLAEYIPE